MDRNALTQLLNRASSGEAEASSRLFTFLYDELKQVAAGQMRFEKVDLQPTGLVHEAFLKLFGAGPMSWENRRHFFGAAAQAMRRILIDLIRARASAKRGGGHFKVTFSEALLDQSQSTDLNEVLDLHDAIVALSEEDASLGQIVELRFFAGQSMEAIADMLEISLSSVERKWRLARAFLVDRLRGSS